VLLLCHANTVDLYRREFQPKQGAKIGITHVSHKLSWGAYLTSRMRIGSSPLILMIQNL
jgi:hypothetical protein